MAKVETVYWDNANDKTALVYSINGVRLLALMFKILGILAVAAVVPTTIAALVFVLDSPAKATLGRYLLFGGILNAIVGYVFWFGLANTLCLLIDIKGTQERLELEAHSRRQDEKKLRAEERAKRRSSP